jgi:hypothetical protein
MKHLTDEQLAGWLAGDSGQETLSHLACCEPCRTEAVQVRDGISRYSLAMRRESARAQGGAHLTGNLVPRKALAWHRLRWAGAGVLVLLLAAPTAWMIKSRSPAPTSQPRVSAPLNPQPAAPMSDDELLEAVNNDLSREVPQALAPVSAITAARNQIAAASLGAALAGNPAGKYKEK